MARSVLELRLLLRASWSWHSSGEALPICLACRRVGVPAIPLRICWLPIQWSATVPPVLASVVAQRVGNGIVERHRLTLRPGGGKGVRVQAGARRGNILRVAGGECS